MDRASALELLISLYNGVNPLTGEIFSKESIYQHPDIIRALNFAIISMEQKTSKIKKLPAMAGKPWTKEEEQRVANNFESGKPIKDIALEQQRTEWAIRSHLIKMGKIKM